MMFNHFRPTFGMSPLRWEGRMEALSAFEQAIKEGVGSSRLSATISGARGIGKTALVGEMIDIAQRAGWVVLRPETPRDIIDYFVHTEVPQAIQHVHSLDGRPPGGKRELTAINVAGLKRGVEELINHEGTTFLRRAPRIHLGPLTTDATESVLRGTLEDAKGNPVRFDESGLRAATELSQGYPYLVQIVGYLSWEKTIREHSNTIDYRVLERIHEEAISQLTLQVHSPELQTLTDKELEFVHTMADVHAAHGAPDHGVGEKSYVRIRDIADRLDTTQQALSKTRARLFAKEVITSPRRGMLSFTIPYFPQALKAEGNGITLLQ